MLVGLQGGGKTTTIAKLARYLKTQRGRSPYLVPADVYRPAAIEQLIALGEQIGVPGAPDAGRRRSRRGLPRRHARRRPTAPATWC